jgi:hypothetical protein
MTTYGLVMGQFTTQFVDNDDPDQLPQTVPLKGTIPLQLNVKKLIDNTDPANPVVRATSIMEGVLDAEGWLCTPNLDGTPAYRGIWVQATDDPDVLPSTNLAYQVSYKLKDPNNALIDLDPHLLAVPGGETVNLASFMEPDGAPVESVAAAQASAELALQALLQAVRTVNGQVPDTDGNVDVAGGTADLTNYYDKTASDARFQPVGSYAAAADLDNVFGIATAAQTTANAAAPNASPDLTGTPLAPTAAPGTNSRQIATAAFVEARVQAALTQLTTGAPGLLDTLDEIAAAIGDDPNFAASMTTALAGKVPTSRTINGHDLTADVTLGVGDVGAAPAVHTHTVSQISDSGTVGQNVVKSATIITAQQAIGIYQIANGGSVAGLPEGALVFEAVS